MLENLAIFLLIIVLLFILVKSAELVEHFFVHLSIKFRINEFFLGFAVLAIITSLPEISVAVFSSTSSPEFSAGNLLGATIVLLTLILGLSVLKYGQVKFVGKFGEKQLFMSLGLIGLMIITLIDQYVTVAEGLLLIGLYSVYVIYLYFIYRKHRAVSSENKHNGIIKIIIKAIVGCGFLIFSASLIVKLSESLAYNLKIPDALLGIFLLGFGTNLLELSILVTSKIKRSDENLSIGNFLGSATVNAAIMGILAILSGGFRVDSFISIVPALVLLAFAVILFGIFSYTKKTLSRFEAIILIATFASLVISELLLLI